MGYDNAALTRAFIELGREILDLDRRAMLKGDFHRISEEAIRLPQPGFVGKRYGGVVLLDAVPGDDRSARPDSNLVVHRWNDVLARWRDTGALDAYEEAFELWRERAAEWRTWPVYVQPVLEALGLRMDDVACLYLFHSPTRGTSPTWSLYGADWPWTKQQLELLQPRAVVVGGKEPGMVFRRFWPDPPFEAVVQNRNWTNPAPVREAEVRNVIDRLSRALSS